MRWTYAITRVGALYGVALLWQLRSTGGTNLGDSCCRRSNNAGFLLSPCTPLSVTEASPSSSRRRTRSTDDIKNSIYRIGGGRGKTGGMLPASLRPSPPKRQQVISKEEDASSPSQRTRPFLPPPSLIINVDNNDIDAIESLSQDDGDEAKEGLAINTSVMAAGLLMALIGTVYVYLHNPQGVSTPFSLDHMTPEGYSFKQSLISGAVAGVSRGLSRILTFPLDSIKTRQQAVLNEIEEEHTGKGRASIKHLNDKAKAIKKGRLFDGLLPMLLVAGPANAAFFVTYDYLVALFTALGYPPSSNTLFELSAALLASLPANVVRIPAEVTKQRVQAGLEKKALTAATNIFKTEGPFGLYVGGKAHLARELPFNAAQFATFRYLKEALKAAGMTLGVPEKAFVGALAAGVASFVTQPLDTIKTSQMLDKSGRGANESYVDGVKRIYGHFGLSGLYLGVMPRFFLCFIGGAFYFLAEEWAKSVLPIDMFIKR